MSAKLLSVASTSPAELRVLCEREAVIELRAYKRRKGLTAEGLAAELATSPDSAERWLAGKSKVPGYVVIAIRRAA